MSINLHIGWQSHRFEIDLVKGIFGDRMGLNIVWDTIETPDSRTHLLHLQSKEDQESDHQTEETHSFGKGETQNGV